jgi:hypothetical protein
MPHQLVSLLYDELSPVEAKKVRAHLKACLECRKAYQELQSTSELLEKWEDAAPNMQWVFASQSASPWQSVREKFRRLTWNRRLAVGLPALAATALLLLAVLNFRIEVQEDRWSVAFSLLPQKESAISDQVFAYALDQAQQETLMLLSQMIEESEDRQQRDFTLTLARFAQDLERQRRQDLRTLGEGLEGLQRKTDGQFHQTSDVLSDLIRLTSYKMERK